jgi:regulator of replication initiation timing
MQQNVFDILKNLFQVCNWLLKEIRVIKERLNSLEEMLYPLLVRNRTQAEIIAELESKADPYSQDGTAFCNETNDNQTND